MKGVTKDEFQKRVLNGKKLDLSVENKKADDISFGIFLITMPTVNALNRVKNLLIREGDEISEPANIHPVYLHVEEKDVGFSLGRMDVSIENFTRLQSILDDGENKPEFSWVHEGERATDITKESLIGTIRFKRSVTIHEII